MVTQPKSPNQKIPANKMVEFLRKDLPRYFLLIATIMVALFFRGVQPKFLSFDNICSIVCSAALMGTLAIAVVIALASGEMNFSVGAQATIAAVVTGVLLDISDIPYLVAVAAGIVSAMLIGSIGIGLTLKFGVPSFIATLAVSTLADGFIKLLTGNKVFFSGNWKDSFTFLGQEYFGSIPVLMIVFFVIVLCSWILVDGTKLGRHIFAIGTNKVACKQVGIDIVKLKLTAFMISSAIAGLAGILSASRSYSISPTLGADMQMNAFAAAMLGGTFLRPGRFNIQGTVVAAILMTIIINGMFSTGADYSMRFFAQGFIFLVAVGVIALTRKEGLPGVKFG